MLSSVKIGHTTNMLSSHPRYLKLPMPHEIFDRSDRVDFFYSVHSQLFCYLPCHFSVVSFVFSIKTNLFEPFAVFPTKYMKICLPPPEEGL